jgi:hypothetical protein
MKRREAVRTSEAWNATAAVKNNPIDNEMAEGNRKGRRPRGLQRGLQLEYASYPSTIVLSKANDSKKLI